MAATAGGLVQEETWIVGDYQVPFVSGCDVWKSFLSQKCPKGSIGR
jgi:hypothetical protein